MKSPTADSISHSSKENVGEEKTLKTIEDFDFYEHNITLFEFITWLRNFNAMDYIRKSKASKKGKKEID